MLSSSICGKMQLLLRVVTFHVLFSVVFCQYEASDVALLSGGGKAAVALASTALENSQMPSIVIEAPPSLDDVPVIISNPPETSPRRPLAAIEEAIEAAPTTTTMFPLIIENVTTSNGNSTLNETTNFVPITFLPPPFRNENSLADNSSDDANVTFLAAAGSIGAVNKNTILDYKPGPLTPAVTSNSVSFRLGVIDSSGSGADEEDYWNDTMMADRPSGSILTGDFGGGSNLAGNDGEDGNLKCFTCESCPASTDKMRKETCVDFSALCVTKVSYTMRHGKLYFVRKSRFCGPPSCPPSSLMSRFYCCSGDLCNGTPSRNDAKQIAIALVAVISAILNRILNR